jgi:DNA-binding CsgD family transcriptional regulator
MLLPFCLGCTLKLEGKRVVVTSATLMTSWRYSSAQSMVMATYAAPKRALNAMHALCRAGWRAEVFVPALLEALHSVIPSARNLFDWTDETGHLLRYFIEGPVDTSVAQLYFDEFHNRKETACMPAFHSLRQMPMGVRGAAELNHPAFFASALYNEVWRPQGLHSRIEGVVRSRSGRLLGSLVLYRGKGEVPFAERDERLLAAVLPLVADALDREHQTGEAYTLDLHVGSLEPPETVVFDGSVQVLHATEGLERLLMLADDGLSRDALRRTLAERLQKLFGRLIGQMMERASRADGASATSPWPSLTIMNPFGRFDAHGSLLRPACTGPQSAPPLLQIVVRRLEPRSVALHRVMRALPISVGQTAVCAALYAGTTQTEIARRIGVTPTTVVDHVRKLYRALEVNGSAELREMLDQRMGAAV